MSSTLAVHDSLLAKLKALAAKKSLEKNRFVSVKSLGRLAIARYLRHESAKHAQEEEKRKEAKHEQQ